MILKYKKKLDVLLHQSETFPTFFISLPGAQRGWRGAGGRGRGEAEAGKFVSLRTRRPTELLRTWGSLWRRARPHRRLHGEGEPRRRRWQTQRFAKTSLHLPPLHGISSKNLFWKIKLIAFSSQDWTDLSTDLTASDLRADQFKAQDYFRCFLFPNWWRMVAALKLKWRMLSKIKLLDGLIPRVLMRKCRGEVALWGNSTAANLPMSIGQSILECCLSKSQSLHQYQGHLILAKKKKIILILGVTACKNWIWCTAQVTL